MGVVNFTTFYKIEKKAIVRKDFKCKNQKIASANLNL